MALWDRIRNRLRPEEEITPEPQEAPAQPNVTLVDQAPETGRTGKIGKDEIAKAARILEEYKSGKAHLESRIISNEQWYKLRHWGEIGVKKNPGDPEPTSAWLFNVLLNKHADAMDSYPAPAVLPREKSDEQDAETLSSILPVILEQNRYEDVYNDVWWYKLKNGTGVTGVFWDNNKCNGIGDIDIRKVDLLNLFWEPGISNIQHSPNVFHVDLVDKEQLAAMYPQLEKTLSGPTVDIAKYIYDDTVDTSKKTTVIDWYYKIRKNGKDVLHFCKFSNGEVLYASENDPTYAERGWYDHGKYPFVMDVLFPIEGSPAGFGYIDICKSPQIYIDKLDQVMLKHAVIGSRPRYFVRGDGSVNEEEFADLNKDFVHYYGSGDPNDSIIPIRIPAVDGSYLTIRNDKINELKETAGNRDWAQGGTTSSVTSGAAIAALQEAGSKLSRDMIKSAYRAFEEINYIVIDLIRQFYTEDRTFRITGKDGHTDFVSFNGRQIQAKPQQSDFGVDAGVRMPIFDLKVESEKNTPYSTAMQNQRAQELYAAGFFAPQMADQALAALDMMRFEGVEDVREKVSANGTLMQENEQLKQKMLQLASLIDQMRGTGLANQLMAEFSGGQAAAPGGAPADESQMQQAGLSGSTEAPTVAKARQRAQSASTPT